MKLGLIVFVMVFAALAPDRASAVETKVNPVTAHELVLMPPTKQQPKPFGWIRLLNGTNDDLPGR